ncbi:MAG: endonuclease/exonuclease/phosphatase family protein [Sandaracinaceae bacterium]
MRWFPDGSGDGDTSRATDVAWMACAMASLGVDAIAVQEVLQHASGRAAMAELRRQLDALTGGRWVAHLDRCPSDGRQHVGWLVNEARVRVSRVTQLDALNPLGGCTGHLRPGLALYLEWPGGPDLHAVSVHLDSGTGARDHRHRAASLAAIERATRALRPRDADVVVLGDLNTMGREAPRLRAGDELADVDALLSGLQPAWRRVPSEVPCTELWRAGASHLDHVLVSASTREVIGSARVHGICGLGRCERPRGRAAALERLSDHCPLVVALTAEDRD